MAVKKEVQSYKRNELKSTIIDDLSKEGIVISEKPLDMILDTVQEFMGITEERGTQDE